MNIEVIRTSGEREQLVISRGNVLEQIYKLIDCDTVDVVNLRDGRVMLVDDNGHIRTPRPPVNPEATKLYHGVCRPGTTHEIVGDVAIALDEDFA